MKKSKLLAGVLVASMALLGTGYAYWTDHLTVNATVKTGKLEVVYQVDTSATGELNEIGTQVIGETPKNIIDSFVQVTGSKNNKTYVTWNYYGDSLKKPLPTGNYDWTPFSKGTYNAWQWNCYEVKTSGYYTTSTINESNNSTVSSEVIARDNTTGNDKAKGAKGQSGYITGLTAVVTSPGTLKVKDQVMTINMADLYPGSFAKVSYVSTNRGSIPATINDVKSVPDMGGLEKEMQVLALVGDNPSLSAGDIASAQPLSNIASVLQAAYMTAPVSGKLEPQQSIKITLVFIFPGKITGYEDLKTDADAKHFDLRINWKQHNAEIKETTTTGASLGVN